MNRRRLLLAGLSAAAVAASPLFAQQAPVEQVERTRLAKGHWMETRATVSRTGRVDVKTSTWSANEGSGFHGAVVVFLLDRDHNRLHSTEPKTFGVNSKLLPGS